MKKNAVIIVLLVTVCCLVVGLTDAVIKPGYLIKSAVKLFLFLLAPLAYGIFSGTRDIKSLFILRRRELVPAVLTGVGMFLIVISGYFVLGGFFDLSGITSGLTGDSGIRAENFIPVALYITFVNSFLEEFFFRGFAFLTLTRRASPAFAYVFSSLAFSLYHVAIMSGWFGLPLTLLCVVSLAAAGLVFNRFDHKSGSVFPSWIIHIAGNLATNIIGLVLFEII